MNVKEAAKKKLLFVISSLTGGGAERTVVNLLNHLDTDRYEIVLVLFVKNIDYQKDLHSSVKIISLDKNTRWDNVKVVLKLRNIIRDFRPDVVISFLRFVNLVVSVTTLISGAKYRLLLSERSYPRKTSLDPRFWWLKKWLMCLLYPRANKVLAVSQAIGKVLEEDFQIQPTKIETIYNPLSIQTIRDKSRETVAHPFFVEKNVHVIMSIGRLIEVKRYDRLLNAFSLLRKKNNNVRLIILGKGEMLEELEELTSQLKINEYVDFVGFQTNPYAWLAKADLFVLSSDYEGFPNVLVEAMACGIPVISTECPSGPGEILTNGKNGMLVPLSNDRALTEAMDDVLTDKELRMRLSEEGLKRVEDFRVEKIVKQYEYFFEKD